VQKCIQSWRVQNPSFEVRIITPTNLSKYIDVDIKRFVYNDSSAHESDIVRTLILEKYGGIWSDASIYLTEPYPFPLQSQYEFVGYYIDSFTQDKEYPVLENWFFATVPHGTFMKLWKEAILKSEEVGSVKEALAYFKKENVNTQGISSPEYLFMHVAAQYVLQKHKEVLATMRLMKAEDGPFKYISSNEWKSHEALENLCKGNHRTGLIKFRGSERNILIDRKDLQECILK
jgi:hypothetical protein